jgi:hypothetical protein
MNASEPTSAPKPRAVKLLNELAERAQARLSLRYDRLTARQPRSGFALPRYALTVCRR